jgi:hypothetical protein
VDVGEDGPGSVDVFGAGEQFPHFGVAVAGVDLGEDDVFVLLVIEGGEVGCVHYWPPSRCWAFSGSIVRYGTDSRARNGDGPAAMGDAAGPGVVRPPSEV